jgi:CheY-like chemotaxis protein
LELIKPAAARKNLQLTCTVAPEVPAYLSGDTLRLRQILLNFLDNAVKFTTQGMVKVELGECGRAGETIRLQITVSDSGCGIPAEKLDSLFEVFTQVDTSSTRRFGGSGLGLSIVKRLATIMDGSVGVKSEPGRGSSFWATVELEEAEKPHGSADTFACPEAPFRDARILVAEDNEVNRRVLLRLLERLGCRVDLVVNGTEAVECFQRDVYQLVLMDLHMPDMDGLEATRRLRQMENKGRRTPIVAVTASAMNEDRDRCRSAGMDDYLAKPVSMGDLTALLQRHISNQ